MGLMAALGKQYKVQPFKVGPDFIDPSHHTAICGRPSRNLDSYMMGEKGVLETFSRASSDADFCVIEGVMGLYDGLDSTEIASTAHVAKILNVPVLLVINAHGASRSVAAVVKGFTEFDNVNIRGIILNNIGSERHIKLIKDSFTNAGITIPIVGSLPKSKDLTIPSRHLGLHMADEAHQDIPMLLEFIEKNVDMDAVKSIASDFTPPNIEINEPGGRFNVRVGVAWDSAFCFYYQDSFDELRRLGAEPVFFSPMSDELPDVDGIYLGGGYPELHASELEVSKTRHSIKKAAEDGMPIIGECGALLYLGQELETDKAYKMVGILPASSKITGKLKALGYTEAKVTSENPVAGRGSIIRGHEFHYSVTECDRDAVFAYNMRRGKGIIDGKDGIVVNNTIASYMHTHPASISFADFLHSCHSYKSR